MDWPIEDSLLNFAVFVYLCLGIYLISKFDGWNNSERFAFAVFFPWSFPLALTFGPLFRRKYDAIRGNVIAWILVGLVGGWMVYGSYNGMQDEVTGLILIIVIAWLFA